jgi:hypothetical protein
MPINTTTLESNLTTKINATSGSTDAKEFLLLGKAVESLSNSTAIGTADIDFGSYKITYSNNYATLSDLPSASTYHGMFAHVHAENAGFFAHGGNWMKLVNYDTSGNLTISGNLTVDGTTTTINSTTLDVDDLNITVAKGAADAAAANGAGISVDGASATLTYASATDNWNFNKGLAVNGALKTNEIIEKATLDTTTSGTLTVDTTVQSVVFLTTDQTANRTINFSNVSANLAVGESISFAIMCRQGGTAYYLNAYQVDGSTVTPKWQGGSAPTNGNTQSVDIYTFTLIRTSSAIEVFASVNQFGT